MHLWPNNMKSVFKLEFISTLLVLFSLDSFLMFTFPFTLCVMRLVFFPCCRLSPVVCVPVLVFPHVSLHFCWIPAPHFLIIAFTLVILFACWLQGFSALQFFLFFFVSRAHLSWALVYLVILLLVSLFCFPHFYIISVIALIMLLLFATFHSLGFYDLFF